MSLYRLESLFHPSSVAVVGASQRERSIGRVVMRNLLDAGFEGPILPVHPKYRSVTGVLAYPRVAELPIAPELAIVCTPPATVPSLLDELGARGTRAAVVLTAGLREPQPDGRTLTAAALEAARRHGLRVLGPNCLGLLVPRIGLNASFAHCQAAGGDIAFVSQSGGMCAAVLDWARSHEVGFSHFVSLGESADVDLADVIDFLGEDPGIRALLLYVESVRDARKFLSAARSVARSLPTIAVKAGRAAEGARAAASHSGALAASDEAYGAAFRRAGIVRVDTTDELFETVETLAHARRPEGDRLLVISNGGGPGVMAVDRLIARGGRLAELDETTLDALDQVLPATWPRSNPIDLIGDAPPERYREALEIAARDPGVDAVLVLHVPTAVLSAVETANAVAAAAAATSRPLFTAWLGGDRLEEARAILHRADLPTYDTLERAVDAFVGMAEYRRLQADLRQIPPSIPEDAAPDAAAARAVIEAVLAEGRQDLSELEAGRVLAAYGVPVVDARLARDAEEAVSIAREVGLPVAVKVHAHGVSHKSDVGGVRLDLDAEDAVRDAVRSIAERVRAARPDVGDIQFVVERMAAVAGRHEVIVGVARDVVFGPLIVFGHGGTAVEVLDDSALALAPLNLHLAGDLIARTRVSRLLGGYRDRPAADLEALKRTLVQVSQLVVDLPEVLELDVNPLLVGEHGVLALDARMRIAPASRAGTDHLAIRPYPKELEEEVELRTGERVLFRPIRPEDEPAHRGFFESLSPEAVYFRFFGVVRHMPHERLSRFTQIDYDREMAFIAVRGHGAEAQTLGVVRLIFGARADRAEFAVVVRSDSQHLGIGRQLLEKGIRYCRQRGARQVVGQVLWENHRMRELAKDLGFRAHHVDGDVLEVTLDLALDLASPAPAG
jgi:acetyltransferase